MFWPCCPRPSAASGLRLSGAASAQFLACNWTPGRLRPPSRKITGGGWRGAFIKPGATSLPPAPCAAPSGAEPAVFLLERAAEPECW